MSFCHKGLRFLIPAAMIAGMLILNPLHLLARKMIFYPARELVMLPDSLGLAYEDVALRASDGVSLHGWLVRSGKPRAVLLYFHGNAGNISHRLDRIALFNRLDLDVLIVDYRGYGRSAGSPDEPGLYLDADAAYDYIRSRPELSRLPVIIFGESLGGAVAAELASRREFSALVLDSTFTSMSEMISRTAPWAPSSWTGFRMDSEGHLRQVKSPVMVIHSPDDETIPYAMGRRLYEAVRGPKTFMDLKGGHNDGYFLCREKYVVGFDSFLKKHGI